MSWTIRAGLVMLVLLAGACGDDGDDGGRPAPPRRHRVQVVIEGSGGGRVTAVDRGLDCARSCEVEVEAGTTLALAAEAGAGARFAGWAGPCDGERACAVTVTGDLRVTARFVAQADLFATVTGAGQLSSDGGLVCPGPCAQRVDVDALVEVRATPARGHVLGTWAGGCAGEGTCQVRVPAGGLIVDARFVPSLHLDVEGDGALEVRGAVEATCDAPGCDLAVPVGATVTIAARSPDDHAPFEGWAGACSGTAARCELVVGGRTSIGAVFGRRRFVTVVRTGSGTGTVASTPAGLDCGTGCRLAVPPGTSVVLRAEADAGSSFTGWAGPCSGRGACTLAGGEQDVTVQAGFAVDRLLTVEVAGQGRVLSTPAAIDCGPTCRAAVADGSPISLWSEPALGHAWRDWSGACTGRGACDLTVDAPVTVRSGFERRVTDVRWSNGPGEEGLYGVAATPDGGAVMGGSISDGGTIELGDAVIRAQEAAVVVSLDAAGRHRWHRVLASSGANQWVKRVAAAPTGHVYALGYVSGGFDWGTGPLQVPTGESWLYLLRLGPDGTTSWLKTEPVLGASNASTIVATPDGGVVLIAHGVAHVTVSAFDPDGTERWRRRWDVASGSWTHEAAPLPDGGVVFAAEVEPGDRIGGAVSPCACDALVRLDASGRDVWVRFGEVGGQGVAVRGDRLVAAGDHRIEVRTLAGDLLTARAVEVQLSGPLALSPSGAIAIDAYAWPDPVRADGWSIPRDGIDLWILEPDLTQRWAVPTSRDGGGGYHDGMTVWLDADRLVTVAGVERREIGVAPATSVPPTSDALVLWTDARPTTPGTR